MVSELLNRIKHIYCCHCCYCCCCWHNILVVFIWHLLRFRVDYNCSIILITPLHHHLTHTPLPHSCSDYVMGLVNWVVVDMQTKGKITKKNYYWNDKELKEIQYRIWKMLFIRIHWEKLGKGSTIKSLDSFGLCFTKIRLCLEGILIYFSYIHLGRAQGIKEKLIKRYFVNYPLKRQKSDKLFSHWKYFFGWTHTQWLLILSFRSYVWIEFCTFVY